MENFMFFAKPWWVNLLILIPIVAYFSWKKGLDISGKILFFTAIFGTAFGYVESAIVVYIRKIFQLIIMLGSDDKLSNTKIPLEVPQNFMQVEIYRETATIIMLIMIALMSAEKWKERTAIFVWTFAFWDIFYYFWLWVILKWPSSTRTQDTLFLIPVPWTSEVWFPMLVSMLAILSVIFRLNINKYEANI